MSVNSITVSKLAIYGIFLNYYFYFVLRGSFIPMGTYLFYGIAILGVLIAAYREPIVVDFNIKCWIGYLVFSIVTIPLAYSVDHAVDGVFKYFQRLVLIILIVYICEREKSIIFAIRLLAVTSVCCVLSCLLTMNSFSQKLTVSSGANLSTNDVGSIAAFGCFAIVFAFGTGVKSKTYKTILKILYIVAAVVLVFVAGSRKSILAIILLFALFFVFCWRDYFKKLTFEKFIMILILGAIAFYFIDKYLIPSAEETNLYVRLFGRGAERTAESDDVRAVLYITALEDFLNNFIVGTGFNNFTYLHGNYTHSTYVEPLACSGIFGLLYLVPYVNILIKQIKHVVQKNSNAVFQKEMLAFYIVFLFVGIGIPYMYKDIPCIILAMFIAWQNICASKSLIDGKLRGDNYGEFFNKGIADNS